VPWVSTKGIAGSRMQGLQRTRASALYTRLIVLPRFLFFRIHLRSSKSSESKRFSVHSTAHTRTEPPPPRPPLSGLFCARSDFVTKLIFLLTRIHSEAYFRPSIHSAIFFDASPKASIPVIRPNEPKGKSRSSSHSVIKRQSARWTL
jgi:hypothetical protein